MTKAEIKALLVETAEGKEVFKELTDGLEGNKNEILSEKKKLVSSLENINTKLSDLESERDGLQTENFGLRVTGAVEKAMDTINVAPIHRRAVAALICSESISIKEQDGIRVVTIGKGDKAEPLEKWAVLWAGTDEGKAYVLSPASHGGGAVGSHEAGSGAFDLEGKSPEQILENLPKVKR